MRSMKAVLINKLSENFSEKLAELSIKLSEQSMGMCNIWGAYEPEVPMELLRENMDK